MPLIYISHISLISSLIEHSWNLMTAPASNLLDYDVRVKEYEEILASPTEKRGDL